MAIAAKTSTVSAGATTTSLTLVIHSSVVAGDILVLALVNRDATTDPSVTDDDAGGNSWTKLLNQNADTNGALTIWWKRATDATASKTITASGFTGSCAGGVTPYSGASGVANPFSLTTAVPEANASGNETQAQINVGVANSMVFLVVANTGNDTDAITSQAATDPSSLTEQFEATSTGGNDCEVALASAIKTTSGNTGAFTWAQTNRQGASAAFALEPSAPSPSISPSPSSSVSLSPSKSPSSSPSIGTPGTTFLEPGTDATSDFSLWVFGITGTAASATDQFHTGPRSIKLSTGSPAVTATVASGNGVCADAGRRIDFWFRFDSLPAADAAFLSIVNSSVQNVAALVLKTNGTVAVNPLGATSTVGTAVLSVNTWYRISLSYTITNTTTFRFQSYINGVADANATAGTMTRTGSDIAILIIQSTAGANVNFWFDDIYIDDGADYTDPGDIRVVAKRPNANGTVNGFTTQIGVGGSGYGTGHSPQVNERPLSTTNGWSMVGAGSAITEEYTIEDAATGDVDITGKSIIDVMGWVYTKALANETGKIVVAGVQSNISITTANKLFSAFANSTTYPAGGTDIGMVTSTDLTTVSLYECGIVIAYLSTGISTSSSVSSSISLSPSSSISLSPSSSQSPSSSISLSPSVSVSSSVSLSPSSSDSLSISLSPSSSQSPSSSDSLSPSLSPSASISLSPSSSVSASISLSPSASQSPSSSVSLSISPSPSSSVSLSPSSSVSPSISLSPSSSQSPSSSISLSPSSSVSLSISLSPSSSQSPSSSVSLSLSSSPSSSQSPSSSISLSPSASVSASISLSPSSSPSPGSPSISPSPSASQSPSASDSPSVSPSPSSSTSLSSSSSISLSPSSSPSASSGRLKYWNGSAWVLKLIKYYDSSTWVEKPLKYWDGAAWQT